MDKITQFRLSLPLIILTISLLLILILIMIIFTARNTNGQVRVNAPLWNQDDMWTYQRLGKSGNVGFYHAMTVLEKSIFSGRRSYKLELKICNSQGELEVEFSKSFIHFSMDLEELGLEHIDKTTEEPLRSRFKVLWPLYDGKSWQLTAYDFIYQRNFTYLYTTSVETVVVPAGVFECFKIVRKWQHKDEVFTETYWYSPLVKNFVKIASIFGTNDELVDYKIK